MTLLFHFVIRFCIVYEKQAKTSGRQRCLRQLVACDAMCFVYSVKLLLRTLLRFAVRSRVCDSGTVQGGSEASRPHRHTFMMATGLAGSQLQFEVLCTRRYLRCVLCSVMYRCDVQWSESVPKMQLPSCQPVLHQRAPVRSVTTWPPRTR